MKCECCNNMVVDGATECPWCGAKITAPVKRIGTISAYSLMLRKDRLLLDEVEVERIELTGGTLLLTTKKIRGNVSINGVLPDGRPAKGLKTIDTLLTMVTGYSVVTMRAPVWVYLAAFCFAIGLIDCICSAYYGVMLAFLFGLGVCIAKIISSIESHLRIAIPGGDVDVKLGPSEREKAGQFAEAIRKTKAEYELKAGL